MGKIFHSKKKISYFAFYIFFSCKFIFSQNLVPNPSFENYSSCPCGQEYVNGNWVAPDNQIIKAVPWKGTNISTDYYNSCANITCPLSGAPHTMDFNHRMTVPHSGSGMSGIVLMNTWDQREYLQVQLLSPLQMDKLYHLKFYTQLGSWSGRAVNNFGCYFSELSFSTPDIPTQNLSTVAPYEPQALLFGNQIIKDTINWTKIESVYSALGGEAFITLGNFKTDLQTDTLRIFSSNQYSLSYYYIDDVTLEEITQPFWQYHDTTVYYGDSVLIGPALTGLDIDWYTDNLDFISNAPGIYVTPPTSRDYIAKETFDGVETDHVVHVTVIGGAGLEENELQNVRVFPNPSKGSFSISGIASDKPLQLEVRDVHGKLVFEEKEFSKDLNSFELDVENGVYFVTVWDLESKEFVVEKLVVSK